jgi:hypothetical protein
MEVVGETARGEENVHPAAVESLANSKNHIVESGLHIVELLSRLLAANLSWQKAVSLLKPCQTVFQVIEVHARYILP